MEDKTYIVYLHVNPKNKKVYVGITNHGYTKCKKFYNAIIKYGWNNFNHIVLCNITDGEEDIIPSMLGKHHTEEIKRKSVIKRFSKAVFQLDLDDNIINRFSSASEAERHLNGKDGHISCCCLGKRKTAYGYKWEYE